MDLTFISKLDKTPDELVEYEVKLGIEKFKVLIPLLEKYNFESAAKEKLSSGKCDETRLKHFISQFNGNLL